MSFMFECGGAHLLIHPKIVHSNGKNCVSMLHPIDSDPIEHTEKLADDRGGYTRQTSFWWQALFPFMLHESSLAFEPVIHHEEHFVYVNRVNGSRPNHRQFPVIVALRC